VPVPMAYSMDWGGSMSALSSMATHSTKVCVDSCRLFGSMMCHTLTGRTKEDIFQWIGMPLIDKVESGWHPEVWKIYRGSFLRKEESQISGSGFVVHTLEAALWAFASTSSFKEGLLKVVNLGDDADTMGAVYGQIAGAYYGVNGIPGEWREELCMKELIEEYACKLFELGKCLVRNRKNNYL